MKCQILFSGKNKKNITSLSSAELARQVVTVTDYNPKMTSFSVCLQWLDTKSNFFFFFFFITITIPFSEELGDA